MAANDEKAEMVDKAQLGSLNDELDEAVGEKLGDLTRVWEPPKYENRNS
jgi:hypothetical protein